MLTACQESAIVAFDSRSNLFLTGNAGTGKSFLVERYLTDGEGVVLLASTGTAAVLVGGRTFHSFFELGKLDMADHVHISKSVNSGRVQDRLRKAQLLVIDEISMLPGRALDIASEICRSVLENSLPWGGLRIACVGDFSQLPPVTREGAVDWAFLSTAWKQSSFYPVVLRTAVRSRDAEFVVTLEDARFGRLTPRLTAMLNGMVVSSAPAGATHLMGRRDVVERYNLERLAALPGAETAIATEYSGSPTAIAALQRSVPVPDVLRLKRGALVMIRKNAPDLSYCNGTLGTVQHIAPAIVRVALADGDSVILERHEYDLKNADGGTSATARNFPLTLAYATTIHKSQGATLSRVYADLRNLWEPGQAYVALSRGVSRESVRLAGWDARSIKADPEVMRYYAEIGWAA